MLRVRPFFLCAHDAFCIDLAFVIAFLGASLVMYLVDSIGNMGGFDFAYVISENPLRHLSQQPVIENPRLDGSSSNCRPTVPYTPINMTFDKQQFAVCDSLMISISGGTKPYTLTIIGQVTQPMQNVTMGPKDDSYEFVNKNGPMQPLFCTQSSL